MSQINNNEVDDKHTKAVKQQFGSPLCCNISVMYSVSLRLCLVFFAAAAAAVCVCDVPFSRVLKPSFHVGSVFCYLFPSNSKFKYADHTSPLDPVSHTLTRTNNKNKTIAAAYG